LWPPNREQCYGRALDDRQEIAFRILGPVELLKDDRPLRLGGARQRTLLAALLLHANEPLATSRLIDEIWGEDAPQTAAKVVQNTVSQLRKLLETEEARRSGSYEVLVKRPAGYELRIDPDRIDARRFERLVEEARHALRDGDAASAAATLREGLELWRGPVLADAADTPFVGAASARLEELRLAALEERIEADLAVGISTDLAGELEALVAQYPLRERLRAHLMLALYRSGRQADALRLYQDTRRLLVDEVGIEPGPALQRLQRAILAQDTSLEVEQRAKPDAVRSAPAVAREVRKTVSVVLAELVALGPPLDPEALRGPLADARETISRSFEHHGATVEPAVGGGILGVFGIPAVHEDDPVRAVRAALEARQATAAVSDRLEPGLGVRLAVRTGVATGELVTGEDADLAGEPIDAAARLQHEAHPDEILIADPTRRLLADAVQVEPVAGAWRLREVVAGASLFPRRLDIPFVGRDRELDQLRRAFERSAHERMPCLFTILGSAGIGKSRLVTEFISSLGRDAKVLAGRCLSYGDGATLWPLAEMVRQLTPEPEGELGIALGEDPTEETFRAVRKLFEALARAQPLVLVFEDVHWAEPTLLDLVEHVVDWSRDVPILVVCLARPELLDTRTSWGGGKLNATAILLEPLSEEDSQALIDGLTADVELAPETLARVAALAEGNPLFLEQMLAMLRERGPAAELVVPPTIQGLLTARLDRLEPEERAVLERAAVIGREFPREAVVELSPVDAREDVARRMSALLHRDLIRPHRPLFGTDEGFEFRHALLREAAYDSVPKRLRAELHERFATWLERAPGARELEEIIGHHLEQAARYSTELRLDAEHAAELTARAAQRLASAGRRAHARADLPSAARLLTRAAALFEAGAPGRVELLVDLGEALREGGELEQAAVVLADAAADPGTADDAALDAQVRIGRLRLQSQVDPEIDTEELSREARHAIEVFERLGDDRRLAKAWELLAWAPWFRCRAAEADAALERAIAYARRAGDSRTEALGLHFSIGAAYHGPTPVAEAVRRCEAIMARPAEQPRVQASALRALAGLEALAGEIDRARGLVRRHRELVEDFGLRVTAASASETYGLVELYAGDAPAAEAEFRRGYENLEAIGERTLSAILAALLAHALYAQGRSEEALRFSELSERAARADDVLAHVQWRSARAKALARTDRPAEAERLSREAVVLIGRTDFLTAHGDAVLDLAEVLRHSGRSREAAPFAEEAQRLYERKGAVVPAARARALLADLGAHAPA
jgi:DNA-binding SARP family transcriptional activator